MVVIHINQQFWVVIDNDGDMYMDTVSESSDSCTSKFLSEMQYDDPITWAGISETYNLQCIPITVKMAIT